MNLDLTDRLTKKQEEGKLFRIGVIGLGKFATMFLSQAKNTPGIAITAIADLDYKKAEASLRTAGYEQDLNTSGYNDAQVLNQIWYTDSGLKLAECDQLDLVIEATGNPEAAVDHCLSAFKAKSHVVLVTVEADILCGPAIIKKANEAEVICSMAYGDQPALICELIDRIK